MSIYTKQGDDGTTSLASGQRLSKSDPIMDACGNIDELMVALSQASNLVGSGSMIEYIETIQRELNNVGAELSFQGARSQGCIGFANTKRLEQQIDLMLESLPVVSGFIFPGVSAPSISLHMARAICRRAERSMCGIEISNEHLYSYINRLGDWLFVAARYVDFLQNKKDRLL